MRRQSLYRAASLTLFCLSAFILTASNSLTTGIVKAQDDRVRELKIRVGATPEEAGKNTSVQLWGVVIGVSRYKNGDQTLKEGQIPNLKNAGDDAQAMYDFLRSSNGGDFRDESEGGHLVLLKDEAATKANVEAALNRLKQAKPNDYFVIYIAAHGALVPQVNPQTRATEETPYFVLHDSTLANMAGTAIRMDAFRKIVSEVPAQKGLVLSDTCHSAGVQLTGRGLNTTIRANARFLDEMTRVPSGVGFLSAADQTELSYELDSLNAGVFTYSLLEGLRGNADINNDGMVNFKELKDYVSDKVAELTERRQRPQANTTSIGANYIPISLVKYAGATTGSGAYGTIVVRTPDLDGVEVSVNGKVQDRLTSRTQSTIKVAAGTHTLSFVKDGVKRNLQTTVEAGKSKLVEVNLSFSEGDEDALVEASSRQVNVFLREAREPSKDAKDLFLKGVDSFNRLKYDVAVELLTKAVQSNNGYADAYVYLGRAYQSLGQERAAIDSFTNALKLRPTDFETRTLLAEARFTAGDNVEEVMSELRDVIRRHPNFDFARVVMADVLLWRGDAQAAELQLKAAIRINPLSPPAHMILADVLTYQDSFEKQKQAADEAKRAIELFGDVSKKQVSASKSLKRLSLSHVIFGGARYENKKAMAEAQHIAGKTLTRVIEYAVNNAHALPESKTYLEQSRSYLQQALTLAQASGDKRRQVLVLATMAQNDLYREDVVQAIKDGELALKTGETTPDMKDLCEVHLTLSNAYNSGQNFPKAFEHMEKFLSACGTQLSADERQKFQEELAQLKRQKDANKKSRK